MPPDYAPFEEPGRKHPARGVLISSQQPTIVFLTICTKDRQPWLAKATVHEAIRKVWQATDTWLVGDYLLMPDFLGHTRLRRSENYTEKWNYVRENPVRAGFVKQPDDWPFQGRMNVLRW